MAYRVRFEVEGFMCLRCGYKWVPRIFKGKEEEPTICPKCKSPYWNKPRQSEVIAALAKEARRLKREVNRLAKS
jgi:predicted Zn-ribbon and HTH transcriptional regulator